MWAPCCSPCRSMRTKCMVSRWLAWDEGMGREWKQIKCALPSCPPRMHVCTAECMEWPVQAGVAWISFCSYAETAHRSKQLFCSFLYCGCLCSFSLLMTLTATVQERYVWVSSPSSPVDQLICGKRVHCWEASRLHWHPTGGSHATGSETLL